MTKPFGKKIKQLIAVAMIAIAGLIGIGMSDAHAGDKYRDGTHRYNQHHYKTQRAASHHHLHKENFRRSDHSSERLGAAIAELFVHLANGNATIYREPRRHESHGVNQGYWKYDRRRHHTIKQHVRGKRASTYGNGKNCYPVKKTSMDRFGNKRIVHGTACQNAYGNMTIVPGSRYVVRKF